jgi:ArsR family transcriptional regulator, arsenate/arsenite/antimonite-responsive transcriptional repressor
MENEATVAARLRELERRVTRLEGEEPLRARPRVESEPALRFLEALQARSGPRYGKAARRGAVGYAGAVDIGEGKLRWAREHPLPHLLDSDASAASVVFACLGNPTRLAIVRHLLVHGSAVRQALQSLLDNASTGQLYHHLHDLSAAGLIAQHGRGTYVLVPHAVVPVLTLLAVGLDLSGASIADESSRRQRPQRRTKRADPER